MNLIKKWWFWLIIVGIIIGITTIIILITKSGVGSGGISLKEYEKIQLGETNFGVEEIVAPNHEWDHGYSKYVEEISKTTENHKYTVINKILGENSGYAIITYVMDYTKPAGFWNLEVVKKEQFDLK